MVNRVSSDCHGRDLSLASDDGFANGWVSFGDGRWLVHGNTFEAQEEGAAAERGADGHPHLKQEVDHWRNVIARKGLPPASKADS